MQRSHVQGASDEVNHTQGAHDGGAHGENNDERHERPVVAGANTVAGPGHRRHNMSVSTHVQRKSRQKVSNGRGTMAKPC